VQAALRQVANPGDDVTEPHMWVDVIETAGLSGWTAPNGIAVCQIELVEVLNEGHRPWSRLFANRHTKPSAATFQTHVCGVNADVRSPRQEN